MNSCKDHGFSVDQQKPSTSVDISELYFLIQKFLLSGPLKRTKEVLLKELQEHNIYKNRLDWEGNEHKRSFEDMEHQFSFIRPDYLLQIGSYIANNSSEYALSPRENVKSMLKFKPKKLKESDHNFRQLYSLITRFHGAPLRNKDLRSNIVNIIRGREVSGRIPRSIFVTPRMYNTLQVQRRTLGHLSSVYCLLFDATGRYILTGADDLLVKLWSANTGRLLASFRGAQYEISDISVNVENTLLAAGSLDHILRVWSLQTGFPVAVLAGHSAMITTVNFCPSSCWNVRYLVSTSSDGAVAFWSYSIDTNDTVTFKTNPTVYQEKMRPGGAKMISSAFSPGGSFLATGSVDHNVRVYYMKGDEGPQRILESELHTDRVDSIQWAHSGIRFLSGSKDGSAVVWYFEDHQWKHIYLHMSTKLDGSSSTEDVKKLKVTMVAWDVTDELFVTAVTDHTLKVWSTNNGQLQRVLTGHTDEFYVLECHPHDRGVMLSAGHDGQVFIWDIFKGEIISRFINTIEGQGVGAIYDGKWSPDGTMIALSDSHGRIIIFGFGPGSPILHQLPSELFFHTDYRPLIRDRNHHIIDEQTQVPPHLMPPPFLVDIDGNPYPPMMQRLVPGREHCVSEQLIPNIVVCTEGGQEVIQGLHEEPNGESERFNSNDNESGRVLLMRNLNRRSRDSEGIRQTTGEWQRDPNIKWKNNTLVPPLKRSVLLKAQMDMENLASAEIDEYHKQMCTRPHMINTSHLNNVAKLNESKSNKRVVRKMESVAAVSYQPESSEEDDISYIDSSDYSDWVLDEGVKLEPPKRSKRRQVTHKFTEESDEEDEDLGDLRKKSISKQDEPSTSSCQEVADPPDPIPNNNVPKRSKHHEVPEKYKPSEWLAETRPRKSPYFPQMGDELVYLIQGHQLYVEAVRAKGIFPVNMKDLPWNKIPLKDYEFVKIVGIRYETKPPRICCLKLALLDETGMLTRRYITVKYHDVPDVLDFLVLKQSYDVAMSRNWAVGDSFRCMIYDEWWLGQIISSSLEEYPNSPFSCYEIKWDNGEIEKMSPWDLEPVDQNRIPSDPSEAVPVLEEELKSILYKSKPEDWNNTNVDYAHQNILQGLSKIMELAIAEPFLAPVDLNIYPTYAYVIEYPIDLSTIRSRFEYKFYRRITAAQFDIRYLASNAEKFNEKHSVIVKHARILTDLCLRVVKQCDSIIDVSEVYRSMLDSYLSSDNEVEALNQPSTSTRRNFRLKSIKNMDSVEWKSEALSFINQIWDCSDSLPFRKPVNKFRYPDYFLVVKRPMDLSTVREKLQNDEYLTPYDFSDDIRLIFENSKTYNTNTKSRIYLMTARLSSAFEEYHKRIIGKWSSSRRKYGQCRTFSCTDESSLSTDDSESEAKPLNEKDPLSFDDASSSNLENIDSNNSDITSSNYPVCIASTSKQRLKRRKLKPKIKKKGDDTDSSKSFESSKSAVAASENEYCSSKCNESYSDSDDEPISSYFKRPQRKVRVPKYEDLHSSDSEVAAVLNLDRSKRDRRKLSKQLSSESEVEESSTKRPRRNGIETKFLTTVSSRGRIRKLTPRAQALMKK